MSTALDAATKPPLVFGTNLGIIKALTAMIKQIPASL